MTGRLMTGSRTGDQTGEKSGLTSFPAAVQHSRENSDSPPKCDELTIKATSLVENLHKADTLSESVTLWSSLPCGSKVM